MVRVSNYSRDSLSELIKELPIEFDLRELGTLQLFRKQKQVDGSKADQEVQVGHKCDMGVDWRVHYPCGGRGC